MIIFQQQENDFMKWKTNSLSSLVMIHRIWLFITYMLNISNVKEKKKKGMDKTEDEEGDKEIQTKKYM